jgi:hypothetical protein
MARICGSLNLLVFIKISSIIKPEKILLLKPVNRRGDYRPTDANDVSINSQSSQILARRRIEVALPTERIHFEVSSGRLRGQRMKPNRFTDEQIIGILKVHEAGTPGWAAGTAPHCNPPLPPRILAVTLEPSQWFHLAICLPTATMVIRAALKMATFGIESRFIAYNHS